LRDEPIDLAQAEATALADRLGGEEGLEGIRTHVRRHAHAGIDHREHDVFARRGCGVGDAAAPRERSVPDADPHEPALGHRVARVDREVQ
jgi:hypothetical protein